MRERSKAARALRSGCNRWAPSTSTAAATAWRSSVKATISPPWDLRQGRGGHEPHRGAVPRSGPRGDLRRVLNRGHMSARIGRRRVTEGDTRAWMLLCGLGKGRRPVCRHAAPSRIPGSVTNIRRAGTLRVSLQNPLRPGGGSLDEIPASGRSMIRRPHSATVPDRNVRPRGQGDQPREDALASRESCLAHPCRTVGLDGSRPARPAPVSKPGCPGNRCRRPWSGTRRNRRRRPDTRGTQAQDRRTGYGPDTGRTGNDQPDRRAGMNQRALVRQVAPMPGSAPLRRMRRSRRCWRLSPRRFIPRVGEGGGASLRDTIRCPASGQPLLRAVRDTGSRGQHRNGHPSASARFRVTALRLRTARC